MLTKSSILAYKKHHYCGINKISSTIYFPSLHPDVSFICQKSPVLIN